MNNFSDLVGKTLTSVQNIDDERIVFMTDSGEEYLLYHQQDCCESVMVEDITGDLDDLIGSPIVKAEESSNSDNPKPLGETTLDRSHTWTFYLLATVKGYVTIRWYGESNGYYSESVSFKKCEKAWEQRS